MTGPRRKASIDAIQPYVAGKAKAAGFAKPIKLSANENPLGCSSAARAAFIAGSDTLHVYADPRASALREAVAAAHGVDPARLVFGAGSDEIFSMACQAYLQPGHVMVQPQFAFAAWAIAARAAGAEVRAAPERDYTVDIDAMLAAVDARTRMMFVANPASPTGTCLPFSEIKRLHAGLPENVLLVLDGAYAEFAAGDPGYDDGMQLAREAGNVIVTRTFSKIYGLAALRIGWGYASAAIADTLERIRLPFNVPAPAQATALAALGDRAFVERSATHARSMRAHLSHCLAEHGMAPLPAFANFVTAFTDDAPEVERALAERGILVRGLTNYDMPNAIRVSVGTEDDMAALHTALADIRG